MTSLESSALSASSQQAKEVVVDMSYTEDKIQSKESETSVDVESDQNEDVSAPNPYLTGWRLHCSIAGMMLGVFLSSMEATVVSTALVNIVNDLQAFRNSAWVINAYLVAFTGTLLVWAQFSLVIGRKLSLALAYFLFIAFSIGCAVAHTSIQLIVLRALQGVGGAGVFNISMTIIAEAVSPAQYPKYVAMVSAMYVLSYALGPLIGGAIAAHTTWRWVFWINVPASVVPLALAEFGLPAGFPHQHKAKTADVGRTSKTTHPINRLDLPGGILFLATIILLLVALQGADVSWDWSSPSSICLLVFSGVSFVLFVLWERRLTISNSPRVPLLTWEFCNLKTVSMLTSFALVSTPFISTLVSLPERFQVVNGLDSFDAAIRLLPFVVVIPLFSVISAVLVGALRVRYIYVLCIGIAFQLCGILLFAFATPSSTGAVPASTYGFEVLLAIGSGINNTVLTTGVPFIVSKKLTPTAMGAGMQFRYLGGAVGLGVMTAALNSTVKSSLAAILSSDQVTALLRSSGNAADLSADKQLLVKMAYEAAFQLQWKILIAFVALQIPLAIVMFWRSNR